MVDFTESEALIQPIQYYKIDILASLLSTRHLSAAALWRACPPMLRKQQQHQAKQKISKLS
jgi:hypothetical protein